eukprot:CAMPEP_0116117870 /NCGR_PEP_ID=MMETSP0329-20121206/1805_1 /TAXON_ID=697910 /ORGANISM="Pseudo-nitzschia arenysensis, Strain B593" /LENGTH=393 /DNA_ID=CAMNT_0003611467 /DNA_START=144 /DNA_END=1325 /DNA_ORIENTATION=-
MLRFGTRIVKETTTISRAADVPFGYGGLYGTNGGGYRMTFAAMTSEGQDRPPFISRRRNLEADETIEDSLIIEDSNEVDEEASRNLYTYTQDDIGKGVIRMCVRSSLGYGTDDGFQEINFIESLIMVWYDLSAGFCITSFNVEPKERLETTAQEDAYQLEAWLCDRTQEQVRTNPDRTLPAPIDSTYLAGSSDASNATYFNQGDLITVCIAPDDLAYSEGVRMDGLSRFDWKRSDFGSTAPFLSPSITLLEQPAIESSQPAGNFLTYYDPADCENGAEYCYFGSILFADFYISQGVVSGDGRANLMFVGSRRNRRLGDPSEENSDEATQTDRQRRLQSGEDSSSFDLSVLVNENADNGYRLKTATGASRGGFIAAVVCSTATAMALLSATIGL